MPCEYRSWTMDSFESGIPDVDNVVIDDKTYYGGIRNSWKLIGIWQLLLIHNIRFMHSKEFKYALALMIVVQKRTCTRTLFLSDKDAYLF